MRTKIVALLLVGLLVLVVSACTGSSKSSGSKPTDSKPAGQSQTTPGGSGATPIGPYSADKSSPQTQPGTPPSTGTSTPPASGGWCMTGWFMPLSGALVGLEQGAEARATVKGIVDFKGGKFCAAEYIQERDGQKTVYTYYFSEDWSNIWLVKDVGGKKTETRVSQ